MKDIYRGAQTVCVWLGPGTDDSNLVISFLTPVLKTFRNNEELDELDYEESASKGFPVQTTKKWQALSALLRRAWWGRVWIVQEVAAASTAMVVCGQAEIPWTEFVDVVRQVIHIRIHLVGVMPTTHRRLFNILTIKQIYDGQGNVPIMEALTQSRFVQATDPRDKICALPGLCLHDSVIDVDYSKSTFEAFGDLAIGLLFRRTNNAFVDSHVIMSILSDSQGQRSMALLSWVPDWRMPSNLTFRYIAWRGGISNAAGNSLVKTSRTDNPNRICLLGMMCDAVLIMSSIAPALTHEKLDIISTDNLAATNDNYEALRRTRLGLNDRINESSSIAATCRRYQDHKSCDTAYSRTLIGNTVHLYSPRGSEPHVDAGRYFAEGYWHFRQFWLNFILGA